MQKKGKWIFAVKANEIQEGCAKCVSFDFGSVAIFLAEDGEYYAINNTCPHQGAALAEGYLEKYTVTCPWHAWDFDIRTGACHDVPQDRVKSYKIKVAGEDLLIFQD